MKQLDKKQMKSVAGSGFDSCFPPFPGQFPPMGPWPNSNQWNSSQNMVTNGFNNNGISNGNDNNVISNGSSS
jgi:hypothetical protein